MQCKDPLWFCPPRYQPSFKCVRASREVLQHHTRMVSGQNKISCHIDGTGIGVGIGIGIGTGIDITSLLCCSLLLLHYSQIPRSCSHLLFHAFWAPAGRRGPALSAQHFSDKKFYENQALEPPKDLCIAVAEEVITSGWHLFVNHFVITTHAITVWHGTISVTKMWKRTEVFKMYSFISIITCFCWEWQ